MHTARFALEQGIDVLAVPGNITSPTSDGTNNLIKSGAIPVTCTNDILQSLKLAPTARSGKAVRVRGANAEEQQIIDLLEQGISEGNDLLATSKFSVEQFNHHLTMLEITAKIRPVGANRWALQ
jgi:DNA processing protein